MGLSIPITATLIIVNACVALSLSEDPIQVSTAIAASDDPAPNSLSNIFRKSRQSRCVRCYDDPAYDSDRSRSAGYGTRGYEDRNWYYYNDRRDTRYDDRSRYNGDRENYRYYYYGYERDDDRYSPRNYDRYDRNRYDTRSYYDRYNRVPERGYERGGYESRNRYDGADRFYDRNQAGSEGRYYDRDRSEQYDSRYPARNDYRTYRPYDETYRGESGFDNTGRGYYYANTKHSEHHQQFNTNNYSPPFTVTSTAGPPYLPERSPESARPPSKSTSSESGSGDNKRPYDFDRRPSDSDSSYAGGWKYLSDKDSKSDGRDGQSSSYGSRPRPLGGAYLHDRDSNVPEAVTNNGTSDDKNQENRPSSVEGNADAKQE